MTFGALLLASLHLVCFVAGLTAAAYAVRCLFLGGAKLRAPHASALALALVMGGAWSGAELVWGRTHWLTGLALWLSYAASVEVLHRLSLHWGASTKGGRRATSLLAVLVTLLRCLAALAILAFLAQIFVGMPGLRVWLPRALLILQLLFCVGGLLLLHNLYGAASADSQRHLRCGVAALALLWVYDLNLVTLAYISGTEALLLANLRVTVQMVAVALVAFGLSHRGGVARFYPSRTMAFQSLSLLLIGGYFVAMILLARGMALLSGDWSVAVQLVVLGLSAVLTLLLLVSRQLRSWLRVSFAKHLFQHRYDYRAEWQRLTRTISLSGSEDGGLAERAIQALCDITECPAGQLYVPEVQDSLILTAHWRWHGENLPSPSADLGAAAFRFFESSRYIVGLDELREGAAFSPRKTQKALPPLDVPNWLLQDREAWVMVPLLHYDCLAGVVVLARPLVARRLDWEDYDLLRVVGGQLASYLVEQSAQQSLLETRQFAEFNRSIAFAMHDIKNLASQLSLLARNAQAHDSDPDFRADMLLTLSNSAQKLQGLLMRLGRMRPGTGEEMQDCDAAALMHRLAGQYRAGRVRVEALGGLTLSGSPAVLEQVLQHLLHNAVEACAEEDPVILCGYCTNGAAVIEIIDRGAGMNEAFLRHELFRPFCSSKAEGYGIGAYQARALIRQMGGQLEVESVQGHGTCFRIKLPLGEGRHGLSHTVRSQDLHQALPQ